MFKAMIGKFVYTSDVNLFIFGIFQELLGMAVLHKFNWISLIAPMFEAMSGNSDNNVFFWHFSGTFGYGCLAQVQLDSFDCPNV